MKPGAIVPLPMGVDAAAAFTPIGGEAVLAYVVRALVGPNLIPESHTVVVAAAPLVASARECLAACGLSGVAVIVAPPPGDRWHCVNAGLEYLAAEPLSSTHVLLHDHRHPLVPASVTQRVMAGLRHGDRAVIPVIEMTDSVKAVGPQGSVGGTVDRANLRIVQFPRGFAVDALSALVAGERTADFDELAAALGAGTSIVTVDGDPGAFGVDLPTDAALLAATTGVRRPA